ncbi:hypothetical protein Tco_0633942 [Tanacetum coccineum]
MDFEITNASTQQNPKQMDEEFTTTAYPSVQESLKLPTKDQVRLEEPASSAGTLSCPINGHGSHSSGHLFSSSHDPPVIDLIMSQPVSTTVQAPLPTSTATVTAITTTTYLPPPPSQQQQSTVDPILVRRIGELEQHMADLLQDNLALRERLDKHGTRLYNLEKLDIPYKVSQVVDKIVTDAVNWATQAPLRARFRDLPTVDMKEILQQRMFKDDSYKANNEEARKKRRKRRDEPRSPPGYPPSQPPPPPLAGASGALGTSKASGSSQLPPPPPPPSTGTSGSTSQQGRKVPSSSKTTASAQQAIDDLMHDDSTPDEQVQVSNDQYSGDDHTPAAAASRKDWWKPLPEEERPATLEPAWTILPSNVSDIENNLASTLASSYEPPTENSFLAKTGDMTTFLNWSSRSSRYGYDYLSEIVLRRADFKEHTIDEKYFKNLYPSDFEDLNLLLFYQTQLNLTKPGWDATGYEFKHVHTIIESPRAVIFPANNNERKIMRFNEIYKFSDGMLTRILETLDYRVKEFKIKRLNPGMNTHFWTEKGAKSSLRQLKGD